MRNFTNLFIKAPAVQHKKSFFKLECNLYIILFYYYITLHFVCKMDLFYRSQFSGCLNRQRMTKSLESLRWRRSVYTQYMRCVSACVFCEVIMCCV